MKHAENETLYHINSESSVNTYKPLKIGDVINTSKDFNPFRKSYEIGTSSLEGYWRFTKELAIEQTRMQLNKELPSRWNCLWLTDLEYLEYWKQQVSNDKFQVLEVKLNGKLFCGDAHWVENNPSPLNEIRDKAVHYWNGNIFKFEKLEYLFEGQAEVVSLIK